MEKIRNIVIYNAIEDGKEIVKSCIFYEDGSVKDGNYDDGLNAVKEAANQRNIPSIAEVKKMLNKELFYTMNETEFKKRYNSFLPKIEKEDLKNEFDNILIETPEDDDNEKVVYSEDYEGSEYTDFTEEEEKENSRKIGCLGGVLTLGCIGVLVGAVIISNSGCNKKLKSTDAGATTTGITSTNDDNNMAPIAPAAAGAIRNNDLYNDYSFTDLLSVTDNEFQKGAMINASTAIVGFNRNFAKNYLESGHDIRAALSFDEIAALQNAYNTYSIADTRAYFNGYEVNGITMSNDYKVASLQLMGAYIIESKENPVDLSVLIDSQEGKDFYNKYHNMFMAAKYAEGEEQVRLVNELYKAVKEDFPVTEEDRTEGIAHSENYAKITSYKLSVAPIIAAAEMLFRNITPEYSLNDLEVDFMNDIGLCNYVDDKFERIETIMLGSYEDNTNPLYVQYRKAIIADLEKTGEYVIDDAHRELSNLRRFQEIVNNDPLWKHRNGNYNGESPANGNNGGSEPKTTTTTKTWTETNTSTKTVTSTQPADIPDDEKKKIDDDTDKENESNKNQGEKDAEEERKRQQDEEDNKGKDLEKEAEEENKKTQEDIDNANKQIDENNKDNDKSNDKPVNEKDIHNADIDDKHTDGNGNVDGSVKNITKDGDGANKDLPDPNKTGEDFDKKAPTQATTAAPTATPTPKPTPKPTSAPKHTENVQADQGRAEIEYDKEYPEYDADGNPVKGKVKQKTR